MNRFFLPADAIHGSKVQFPADRSHQIVRVLRLQTGDQVCVLDNSGKSYLVELIELDAKFCLGEIREVVTNNTEPLTKVHLLVALTQREKFELILQKCTEIGVDQFTPIFTERSLAQGISEVEKKAERWGRIVMEASEQCQRGRIPQIDEAITFKQSLITDADQKMIAFEGEHKFNIHNALSGSKHEKIALIIGPEGGFSRQEVDLAAANGWKSFSLGPRILRMETAAVVAVTLILDHFGDLG